MHTARPNHCTRSALLAERAHAMRQSPTASEQRLWVLALRKRGLGVEFRRQVVIANFIVDFLAPEFKLVVEVDGHACHERRRSADEHRDRKLARLGYRVLRIDAELVESDLPEAVARIRTALAETR